MVADTNLAIVILNSVNILLSGILVLAYHNSNKLQKHPGKIIQSIALCEILTSYHGTIFTWGTGNVVQALEIEKFQVWRILGIEKEFIFQITCWLSTTIFIVAFICGLLYNLVLCIDMTLTLRNPFRIAYKRMPKYHLIVAILALSITGYISYDYLPSHCSVELQSPEYFNYAGLNQTQKITELGLTSATRLDDDEKFKGELKIQFFEEYKEIVLPLVLTYLVIGLFTVFYSICRLITELKLSSFTSQKKSLIPYIIYISVNVVLYGFFVVCICLEHFFNLKDEFIKENYNLAGNVLTYGGVLLAIIRYFNKNFRDKIFQGNLLMKDKEDNNRDDEWNKSIIEVFNELKTQITSKIFDCLSIAYKSNIPELPSEFKPIHALNIRTFRNENVRKKQDDLIFGEVGCTIEQICPEIFFSIMRDNNISYRTISESVNPFLNIDSIMSASEGAGKSESFFCITFDNNFVIKTVKASEILALKKNILKYREYIKDNKNTMMCKILGAFVISFPGISSINLIIMENITYNLKPTLIYDLKGSLLNRKSNSTNSIGPFKDLDFLEKEQKIKRKFFDSEMIKNDSNFLASCNLMDYSLLVCICENRDDEGDFITECKIIDYLTEYKLKKRVERVFTSIINPRLKNNASVINPREYAGRFINFMNKKVFEPEAKIVN